VPKINFLFIENYFTFLKKPRNINKEKFE